MSGNFSSAPSDYGVTRPGGQFDTPGAPRNIATSPTHGLPRLAPEALAFDLEADVSLPFEQHQRNRSESRSGWGRRAVRPEELDAPAHEVRLPKPVGSTRSWVPSNTASIARTGQKPSFADMIWGDGASAVHRAVLAMALCAVGLLGVLLSVGGPVQVAAALIALIGAPVVLWPHVFRAGADAAKYTIGLVMAVSVLVIASTVANQLGVVGIGLPVALIGVVTLLAGAVAVHSLIGERRAEVVSSMDAIDSLNTHNPGASTADSDRARGTMPRATASNQNLLSDIPEWQARLRDLADERDVSRGAQHARPAQADWSARGSQYELSDPAVHSTSPAAHAGAPSPAVRALPAAPTQAEADDTSGPALSWLAESYGW